MSSGTATNSGSPGTGIPDPAGRTEAMNRLLAQNWWALALRGVFAILFGFIALLAPGATLLSFVLFFSAYMLVDGIFAIVAAVRAAGRHERWGLLVLEGLANIATGVIAFVWPGLTVLAFVLIMAVWSLVTGILMAVAAFKLHRSHGRGWLVFSGVVSVLFGLALIIAPLVGAVVLTWWLGAYAIAFGASLLVLAFRLRGRSGGGAGMGRDASGREALNAPR